MSFILTVQTLNIWKFKKMIRKLSRPTSVSDPQYLSDYIDSQYIPLPSSDTDLRE